MLLIGRIHDRLQKTLVSRYAANIFWRRRATAIDALGIVSARVIRQNLRDPELQLPFIAEIVSVQKQFFERREDLSEFHSSFIEQILSVLIIVGSPITLAANLELVKMAIKPVHDGLQNHVEIRKRMIFWNEHYAPNLGIDPLQ